MEVLTSRSEPAPARSMDSAARMGRGNVEDPPASGRLIRASVCFIAFLTVGCWLMAPPVAKRLAHAASPALAPSAPLVVMKPIEQVREGDYVLARYEWSSEQMPRRVVATARRPSNHQRLLRYRSSDGSEQVLETTDEHPFWVHGAGWKTARELDPGDSLRQFDGGQAILESSTRVAKPDGVAVYNMEVEGFHTYYVAAHGSRAPPVWVHNKPIAKPSLGNIGTIGKGSKNVFPDNPNNLLPGVLRDSKGRIYPNSLTRIRPEAHSLLPGETFNPRHHGLHYHVDIRQSPTMGWNNKQVFSVLPPNYVPGGGTGFLPGELFPGH